MAWTISVSGKADAVSRYLEEKCVQIAHTEGYGVSSPPDVDMVVSVVRTVQGLIEKEMRRLGGSAFHIEASGGSPAPTGPSLHVAVEPINLVE